MICLKCGAENGPDAAYCTLCFEPLGEQGSGSDHQRPPEERTGMARCPNCRSPFDLSHGFCGRCGYEPAPGECEEMTEEEEDAPVAAASPAAAELEVTAGADGAELMRRLMTRIDGGERPRLRMRGREGISYGMKLVARLTADLEQQGRTLWLRASLAEDEPMLHLDDVDLTLELAASGSANG